MKKVNISSRRKFSLDSVQTVPVVTAPGLELELLCFEAGQRTGDIRNQFTVSYQVLEGELIVRSESSREQAGSGSLITVNPDSEHTLENAGGGLLSVLAIRASA